MFVMLITCPGFRKRCALPALVFSASLALTPSAMGQRQAVQFARECAVKEIAVLTLIEDHGAADDLPPGRLGEAGLMMFRARWACYEGHVSEALALYDSILALGPVANKQ